jgi:hypothetical protein
MSDETTAASAATPPKERVETTVQMQDGRSVVFVGKRKLLKETLIDGDIVSVRLDFINGETRTFPCPGALLLKAAGHGLEQKLGDEVAGVTDVDDQVIAIDELIDRLAIGEWTTARSSSGVAGTSVLFKALVEVYSNKTPEELKAFLKTKSQADKLALRNSARLKPVIERLEAEKASGSKVDAEALLADLG